MQDIWQEVAELYKTLPEEDKISMNKEFERILQEEIDREFIRQITKSKDTK